MISPDPKTTFPHVLACDAREPRSRQVRWFLRNLTQGEWARYAALARRPGGPGEAPDELDGSEAVAALFDSLRLILAGWRGAVDAEGNAAAFDPARLEEVLTLAEAWELYYAGLQRLELTGDDRKNSGSPRPSDSGASAATATA